MMFNELQQASNKRVPQDENTRSWGNRMCSHSSLKKEGLKLKRNLPENFQLSVKGMSVQAEGNSWRGRAKESLYSTKRVRSPDWPGNPRLHTADKKREMPQNKMTI